MNFLNSSVIKVVISILSFFPDSLLCIEEQKELLNIQKKQGVM